MTKHIKINTKTHGRNICLFGKKDENTKCIHSSNPTPKNRTCYCNIIEERTKCVTECDDYEKYGNKNNNKNIIDNEYPIAIGDHDSIINSLGSISGIEINNSIDMLEKQGLRKLSNKLSKAMLLIESVIDELMEIQIDFRIGV